MHFYVYSLWVFVLPVQPNTYKHPNSRVSFSRHDLSPHLMQPRALLARPLLEIQLGIAPRHRPPIRFPRRAPLDPRQHARILAQMHGLEPAHRREAPHHHDVRRRELLACQIRRGPEPPVDVRHGLSDARIRAREPRVLVVGRRGARGSAAEKRRLQARVAEVEPVQVVGVVGVRGRQREAPAAVLVDEVFDDGAGLGEHEGVLWVEGGVFQDGRGACVSPFRVVS